MNSLSGHIADFKVHGNLSLVTIAINERLTLQSIVIETPDTAPYLSMGTPIRALFKETCVVISIGENHTLSLMNRIKGLIRIIERGELISRVIIDSDGGEIVAVIDTVAVDHLQLKMGQTVTTMLKSNEIMLSQ